MHVLRVQSNTTLRSGYCVFHCTIGKSFFAMGGIEQMCYEFNQTQCFDCGIVRYTVALKIVLCCVRLERTSYCEHTSNMAAPIPDRFFILISFSAINIYLLKNQ